MTPENFCYWLRGFMEISRVGDSDDKEGICPNQVKIIKEHLNLVFSNCNKLELDNKHENKSIESIVDDYNSVNIFHPSRGKIC